jgi:hypothetical protein
MIALNSMPQQPMTADEVLRYVKAAARAMNLPLDENAARTVAEHLGRTAAMATLIDGVDLAAEDELAEIYRPAPFPISANPEGAN